MAPRSELPLNIELPFSLPKKGSRQQISGALHEFAQINGYRWKEENSLFPENQNGHQIFHLNFPGGSAYHLYIDGIIPEAVYIFQKDTLIGLQLNKINFDEGVVNRDHYVFTKEYTHLTRIIESTSGQVLAQEKFEFPNQ